MHPAGSLPFLSLPTTPPPSSQVVPSSTAGKGGVVLIAAGGNFFSNVGGIYSSVDGGSTWSLDVNNGQEFKACRQLPLPALSITRVFCVSGSSTAGSIYSADIKL